MDLKQSTDRLKFDSRMLDINLKNSTLKPQELDQYLKQLPDLSGQCRAMTLEEREDNLMDASEN